MQEKTCLDNPSSDNSHSDYFYSLQRELYSILGEIKRTEAPLFIESCLKDCQEILSTRNTVFGSTEHQVSLCTPPPGQTHTTPKSKKRTLSEAINQTAETNPTQPLGTVHKTLNSPNASSESKNSSPTKKRAKIIVRRNAICSFFLKEYIKKMAQSDFAELEKIQREMKEKNEHYNRLIWKDDTSMMAKKSNSRKEIKSTFSETLQKKFIHAHHVNFPFATKKNSESLPRLSIYENKRKRHKFIVEQVMSYLEKDPILAAQNLMYLYQHHLMYSIYLQRVPGDHLSEIIVDRLIKLGFDLDSDQVTSLKSSIKMSYYTICQRNPFNRLINYTPLLHPITFDAPFTSQTSEGPTTASITLDNNPNRTMKRNDTFDEPFPNSLKIEKDTNFYDKSGKLIGVYRVNAIPSHKIGDKLREELASVTLTQLSRMGAASSVENTKKRENKENFHNNIRSAPFGVLGKKLQRVRPTQFSEAKFAIEDGLAPLFEVAEKIYAECAPVEYKTLSRAMGFASAFFIKGSNYLITAEANFDKQTTVHVDQNKFPYPILNPLMVIYPSVKNPNGEIQRTYEGGYTFFPGVCGISQEGSNFFEGIYFDIKEGDVLLWDFERYFHCNTKLVPLNEQDNRGWHRISIIGFTKGEALKKLVDPLVFEDTDDEDSAIFEIENEKDTPDPMEKQYDSVDVPETIEETDIDCDGLTEESDMDCDGLTIVEDEELWSDLPVFNSELGIKDEKKHSYFPSFFFKNGRSFQTNSSEQTPDNPSYGV